MSEDCIFCKIIKKEIPSEFLHEDDQMVVFRDIRPQAPVHLLVVPKKHIRSINDLEEEDSGIVAAMIMAARKIAAGEGIAESGYKLQFHVEKGGGQEIFHLHMHLIGGWKR